jgi:hypothetical protein
MLDRTFKTRALDNCYLKLTLLPDLAGALDCLQADRKLDVVVSPRARQLRLTSPLNRVT